MRHILLWPRPCSHTVNMHMYMYMYMYMDEEDSIPYACTMYNTINNDEDSPTTKQCDIGMNNEEKNGRPAININGT